MSSNSYEFGKSGIDQMNLEQIALINFSDSP